MLINSLSKLTCNIMSTTKVSQSAKNAVRRSTRNISNKSEKPSETPNPEIETSENAKTKPKAKSEAKPKARRKSTKMWVDINEYEEEPQGLNLSDPDGYLDIPEVELNLERTLLGGQSFRWKKKFCKDTFPNSSLKADVFTGVIGDSAFRLWRTSDKQIAVRLMTYRPKKDVESPVKDESLQDERQFIETKAIMEDYFQLKYNLQDLYKQWSSNDKHFAECSVEYPGFRILRQDPVENFFSFICATNNNIKRISKMIADLSRLFGSSLWGRTDFYCTEVFSAFPSVEMLARQDVFDAMRERLRFGYRAKFIQASAIRLLEEAKKMHCTPREVLLSYRKLPYEETRKNLMAYPGIGRKVADCICLMSMDHLGSVPVDCHVYQIVARHYLQELDKTKKSVSLELHDRVGNLFRNLHGPQAGWSSSVLFIAELKHLKPPEDKSLLSPVKKKTIAAKSKSKSDAGSAAKKLKSQ